MVIEVPFKAPTLMARRGGLASFAQVGEEPAAADQPASPGLPATPTNLGVLILRGVTRPPCA